MPPRLGASMMNSMERNLWDTFALVLDLDLDLDLEQAESNKQSSSWRMGGRGLRYLPTKMS
ncbi:hypothetical protein PG987_004035 [Apiospora arundinis]